MEDPLASFSRSLVRTVRAEFFLFLKVARPLTLPPPQRPLMEPSAFRAHYPLAPPQPQQNVFLKSRFCRHSSCFLVPGGSQRSKGYCRGFLLNLLFLLYKLTAASTTCFPCGAPDPPSGWRPYVFRAHHPLIPPQTQQNVFLKSAFCLHSCRFVPPGGSRRSKDYVPVAFPRARSSTVDCPTFLGLISCPGVAQLIFYDTVCTVI